MESTDLGSPSPQLQVVIPSEKSRRKRERERKHQKAAHFKKDLQSGDYVLFLQEVPKIKVSHCRAWNYMPERQTGEPIIHSYYRFALKDVSGLHKNYIRYYHITCVERFSPNLSTLIRDGHFRMDGWIAAPPDSKAHHL